MDTDNTIFPFVKRESETSLRLREIYVNEICKDKLEDERVCAVCMQAVACKFTSIEETDADMRCRSIPEDDFSCVKGRVICKVCLDSLDTQTNSLSNVNIKQEINDIFEDKAIENLFHINHEEEIKSEEIYSSTKIPIICNSLDTQTNFSNNVLNVKQEINDISDDKGIDSVSCFDAVDTQTNFVNSLVNVKQEINDICANGAVESVLLIKSEENYGDTSCTIEYKPEYITTVDISTLKGKRKRKQESKDEYPDLKQNDSLENHIHKCVSCDYTTDQKRNLLRHQLKHKKVPEEQMYQCDSCEYKTKRKYHLTQHQFRHKNIPKDQMYKCDLCDYRTAQKRYLTSHKLRHKNIPEQQMYKCDLCDHRTIDKNDLAHHQLTHKDEEQIFKCDMCNYKTVQEKYLISHKVRHRNTPKGKMYTCDVCGHKTVYKNGLVQHKLIHKEIPEDQMYKCNVCDYRNGQKKYLRIHMMRHETYKCDLCGFKSICKDTVIQHTLKHKTQ